MRTEETIERLKNIPNGWRDAASKKPANKAVKKVQKVLTLLEQSKMPWPTISVVPNGGLLLVWLSLTRDVSMTIDTDGDMQFVTALKYLDRDAEVIDRVESEGYVSDMKTLYHMMAWYMTDAAARC